MDPTTQNFLKLGGPMLVLLIISYLWGRKCAKRFDNRQPWLGVSMWLVGLSSLLLLLFLMIVTEVEAGHAIRNQLKSTDSNGRSSTTGQPVWRVVETRRLGPFTIECDGVLDMPPGYKSTNDVYVFFKCDPIRNWVLPASMAEGAVVGVFAVAMLAASKGRAPNEGTTGGGRP